MSTQHVVDDNIPHHSNYPTSNWLKNSRSTLLVVFTLITTLSFELGVNPPGGFWQDDKDGPDGHTAGHPILSSKNYLHYLILSALTWLCFYSSVVLIIHLLAGISLKSRFFNFLFIVCIADLEFMFLAAQWHHNKKGFIAAVGIAILFTCTIWQSIRRGLFLVETVDDDQVRKQPSPS